MKGIFLISLLLISMTALAGTRVGGYSRKNGTYVQSHIRTSPDGYKPNNYSFKGNYNPYTGKLGTKKN